MKNAIIIEVRLYLITRDFGFWQKQINSQIILKLGYLPKNIIYLVKGCKRQKSINKIRKIMNHKLREKATTFFAKMDGIIGLKPEK